MTLQALILSAIIIGLSRAQNATLPQGIPDGWESMEVEAKWNTDTPTFERIVAELSGDGTTMFGYDLVVRWGGIPRKFVDYYYDTDGDVLTNSSHALRHRTRYTSKTDDRLFSTLVNEEWDKDWERIQYKSTPTRVGAIWFRREVGDCLIWDDDRDTVLCDGIRRRDDADEIIPDSDFDHPALSFMQEDHPNVDRATLSPSLAVTDFRYRVVFSLDGAEILEVSLDTLLSENLKTNSLALEYEVELEIIANAPADHNLSELFRIGALFEERYELVPSGRSKGGNFVPDSAPQVPVPEEVEDMFGSGGELAVNAATSALTTAQAKPIDDQGNLRRRV